jgi:hypothetical protein
MFGEATPPPNRLDCPKPTSSRRINTILGAAFGGRTICQKVAGSESWHVRPTSPLKRQSGRGSENISCDGGAGAVCC